MGGRGSNQALVTGVDPGDGGQMVGILQGLIGTLVWGADTQLSTRKG